MPHNTIKPDQIKRWHPLREKKWEEKDGCFTAHIYTEQGVVEFFAFQGDQRTAPFTALQLFLWPCIFQVRLPRAYHQRWARRLASEFAWRCAHIGAPQ